MGSRDGQRKALHREIGKRLRERRSQRGMSQEAVGALAGIRQGVVSAMERGENLSVINLLGVTRALDCSLDYAIAGRDECHVPAQCA